MVLIEKGFFPTVAHSSVPLNVGYAYTRSKDAGFRLALEKGWLVTYFATHAGIVHNITDRLAGTKWQHSQSCFPEFEI